ncbi:hypothetical protein [Streptomyces cylindrosporus]|uniref:Uncharacterized protein n=1 Tax=Streptomyces cylindrosporus TaxID=2927583 RepID=A0ABS9Y685_9ACTN|nr:hypothetical protein [Streptomyces cylindrosporus]MCI3272728.1 hypothetical protein [Streptomyces cylindrosporus]
MPDMSASVSLALTNLVPLAKEVDENKVTPGVLGFIVFAAMALAVWWLMKSMSRHMNKVEFTEVPDPRAESSADEPTDAETSTGSGSKSSDKTSPAKG